MPESPQYDVIVVGAGPAGSTVARLLALGERRVLLISGPRRRTLGEVLPPSAAALLDQLGLRVEVEAAGFQRISATTVHWGGEASQAQPGGLAVMRPGFDALLLELAQRAGATLARNSRAPKFDVSTGEVEFDGRRAQARFIVGATGRSGLLARQLVRYWDPRYRTLALCALWRGSFPDSQGALIESYSDGWIYSAPVDSESQYVYALVDSDAVRQSPDQAYRAAVENTRAFREVLAQAVITGPVWCEDASPYRAARFAAGRWLLAGDSGCYADPLTWAGVERALDSARHGAAVINACLDHPELAEAAARSYDECERRAYADHIRRASERYAAAAEYYGSSFWRARSRPPHEVALPRADELPGGIERLRASRDIRPRGAGVIRFEQRAALRGGEIALTDVPTIANLSPETDQVEGVRLPALAALAEYEHSIEALHEAYGRTHAPAARSEIEQAVAVLVELGVLVQGR